MRQATASPFMMTQPFTINNAFRYIYCQPKEELTWLNPRDPMYWWTLLRAVLAAIIPVAPLHFPAAGWIAVSHQL